ncbi:MAG: phosphopyruvate hydratase [Patescibacteria group bacterium]
MKHIIKKLHARQIIDSRSSPTIEVDIVLESGARGRAAVPAGASTGETEAVEKRDEEANYYHGRGVKNAVTTATNVIAPKIINQELDQEALDLLLINLDGTDNKNKLGANTILAVSLAFAQAQATAQQIPLYKLFLKEQSIVPPRAMFNILNGGAHTNNGLAFQEFMVMPKLDSWANNLRCGVEIYNSLKKILETKNYSTAVGDEGGFSPHLENNRQALDLILTAGQKAGYRPEIDFELTLDIAANSFFKEGQYQTDNQKLDRLNFIDQLIDTATTYPIYSIEDPLVENDLEGFAILNQKLANQTIIIGDDLTVTSAVKIKEAAENQAISGVIIKPNQIGTVTETIKAVYTAKKHNLQTIVSHRSGETEDISIAHLAIGLQAPLIKFGAPARGERTAKYNEISRIIEQNDLNNFNI